MPDDRVRLVVELQRLSNGIRPGEATVGESCAEDRDASAPARSSASPNARPFSIETPRSGSSDRRDHLDRDALRIADRRRPSCSWAGTRPFRETTRRWSASRRSCRCVTEMLGNCGVCSLSMTTSLWMGIRKRREQDRIRDGEHRSVRADAERQRENGDRRERRPSPQVSDREPQILHVLSVRAAKDSLQTRGPSAPSRTAREPTGPRSTPIPHARFRTGLRDRRGTRGT